MVELAIIGGGVSGLALARALHRRGVSFALFEARERFGGRVLATTSATNGVSVDLGPTWFWPETQPFIADLICDLGLAAFPQYDEGGALHLDDANEKPRLVEGGVHGGAQRLAGGMTRLIDALLAELPQDSLRPGFQLTGLADRGGRVELTFRCGDLTQKVEARHVALALPPRLVEQNVRFEPALDAALVDAMRACETWMAAQAKVVIAYDRPAWREAGFSGNAFVTHSQAVLGEVFDACDETSAKAALGGFLALSADQRREFGVGLPILMDSQMSQLFGVAAVEGEQHYQDWAQEPLTCSALDRSAPAVDHPSHAHPFLRRPAWGGKLFVGGSETAAHAAGYLEGAIDAAKRIERDFIAYHETARLRAPAILEPLMDADASALNEASLARFGEWASVQAAAAFESYRVRLNKNLARQLRSQLTQRAILASVEEVYSKALAMLDSLPFDARAVEVEKGRSKLTPAVQAAFGTFLQKLMDEVIAFNATSCALSNFPDEHHLSGEYVQTILRDIAAAWREFSLAANALLLAKQDAAKQDAALGGQPGHETMMEMRLE
ncbi:flavin monoamine oxidase family protein [Methylocapsa palsarum]|uniref:Monoamine oxidase n=1 Tax=Methylocapsa palsarum TaxID=1612308 RepID=A0A1I3W4U3_9HYPH|nr:FAD-dependent oxidoreductase [Methylocapsa palsarum]SFK02203.1 monoamine oxidase [Methylocapsa palsarum]